MIEKIIKVKGIEICTEAIGSQDNPCVLLYYGSNIINDLAGCYFK